MSLQKDYLKMLDENAELKWLIDQKNARFERMLTTGIEIGEQNKAMKEALFAVTQAKGLGTAKMLAQTTLTTVRIEDDPNVEILKEQTDYRNPYNKFIKELEFILIGVAVIDAGEGKPHEHKVRVMKRIKQTIMEYKTI